MCWWNFQSVRNEVQKRLPKEWAEDEVAQLTEIWEVVKEDDGENIRNRIDERWNYNCVSFILVHTDPVGTIHAELRVKRSKAKIKDKLLELGLVQDRKELRKKRSTKKSGSGEFQKRERGVILSGPKVNGPNQTCCIQSTA